MKSILITGAASGIGLATARLFAGRGWFVGLADRDRQTLAAAVDDIGPKHGLELEMDVAEPASVAAGVARWKVKTNGRMDALFNSAGLIQMGHFETADAAGWQRLLDVNLGGTLRCIQASLPMLRYTPGAVVVNMSSASAIYGTPELAVYSATKFGVRGLTEALNIELAPLGVHVCDVMAPYVKTPMIDKPELKATSVRRLGVRMTAESVADTVWRAVNTRSRVHWTVGRMLPAMMFGGWLLPFLKRPMIRLLAFSRQRA